MRVTKKILAQASAVALVGALAVALVGTSAYGDTVSTARASAYGVQLAGPVPLSARPVVSATAPAGHAEDALVEVPADPAATSFTAAVTADAAKESTLDATLQAVMAAARSGLPTKWNARGHAVTEDLDAAADTVKADVVESESVAACVGGKTVFGSAGRIVNLQVGSTTVTIPAPTPNQVVFNQQGIKVTFWETNWNPATGTTTDGSATVFTNALHVTAPQGIDLVVSHTEASATCVPGGGPTGDKKQCEDGVDNNDPEDSLADEKDPGCHTDGDAGNPNSYDPKDDNERNEPECVDGVDNDDPEDSLADEDDPGCHTDGDATNPDSYDPTDDNENDKAECVDGVDNDDPEDTVADEDDPGCHTDGDATNPDSFDRTDDDETDEGVLGTRTPDAPPASAVKGDPAFTG